MPRSPKVVSTIISAAIFIVMEVAALNMMSHNAVIQRGWVCGASHRVMAALWGSGESIANFFSLNKQNELLSTENFMLRQKLLGLESDAELVAIPRVIKGFEYTPAEIVKMSRNRQHNYIILSKGYKDGIREKSGVITSDGAVGIIDAVSAHFSYAFSFQNTETSISARLGTEGAVGALVWDGVHGDGAILKEIPLQFRYEKGDTVYTSGYSSLFPADIPLGTAQEAKVVNGATNEIKVKLFRDFSTLRYVTIVRNTRLEELEGFGK